ncbi:unnamed protein product [Merluccius merluccius]
MCSRGHRMNHSNHSLAHCSQEPRVGPVGLSRGLLLSSISAMLSYHLGELHQHFRGRSTKVLGYPGRHDNAPGKPLHKQEEYAVLPLKKHLLAFLQAVVEAPLQRQAVVETGHAQS